MFQGMDGYVADEEDEYDEVDEDDRDRYKDQLCAIGAFARLVPDHVVPLLARWLLFICHPINLRVVQS